MTQHHAKIWPTKKPMKDKKTKQAILGRPHKLKKNSPLYFDVRGKSFSEALILASTDDPKYDKGLLIELRVQYIKIPSSEHVVYINCFECQNKNKKPIFEHNMFSNCIFLVIQ